MERFTFRTVGGTAVLYLGNSSEWAIISGRNNHEYKISGDAAERLAAYEDTGLEPEEIKVHEAVKYNAGYYHGDEDRCRWIEKELGPIDHIRDLLQAERSGRLVMLPCKVGDTVYQLRNRKHAKGVGISPRIVSSACVWLDGSYALCHQGMTSCQRKDFGKTWFLTEEEANLALEKEGDSE